MTLGWLSYALLKSTCFQQFWCGLGGRYAGVVVEAGNRLIIPEARNDTFVIPEAISHVMKAGTPCDFPGVNRLDYPLPRKG